MLRPSITYKQARHHLSACAEIYPDRVTEDFTYYDEHTRPLCLLAHLMEAFGADTERIRRIANESYMPTIIELVDNYGVIYVDLQTLEMLYRAQSLEDQGWTWGDAIKEALND